MTDTLKKLPKSLHTVTALVRVAQMERYQTEMDTGREMGATASATSGTMQTQRADSALTAMHANLTGI